MIRALRPTTLLAALALAQGCAGAGPAPTARLAPEAGAPPQLTTVSAGANHMCGLTAGGTAWCWGSNDFGQLGTGSVSNEAPRPVRVAGAITFRRLSAGGSYTCGVAVAGAVFCWGLNADGQLGATTMQRCQGLPCSAWPVTVESPLAFDEVSAGFFHTCALAHGRAFCWGDNARGELGNPTPTPCAGLVCLARPEPVAGSLRFQVVSARGEHTCGISGGAVYCWGDNRNGELGTGTTDAMAWRPRRVDSPVAFADVKAGGLHTCALAVGGQVYCWGSNISGNLGQGVGDHSTVPVLVAGGRSFVALATGGAHTCVLAADRTVACWGSDAGDVLGAAAAASCGAAPCSTTPLEVAQLRDVSQLSAGGSGTCAIALDGLHCWGKAETLVIASAAHR